ncbi:GNAT family N-acetyltransferase [Dyella marensis]|uniref:GNAT family N-acetyltransferase n=1 Tax=Dyella marensis TaxID=500610 RepID=UPI0031DE3D8E
MINPMEALRSFQEAYDNRELRTESGRVHRDLIVHADQSGGAPRMTYAQFDGALVAGLVEFVLADPIDNVICWQTGYAVREEFRGRGLGAELLQKGIDEMQNGFRNLAPSIYVEAVIAKENLPSRRIAERVLGGSATDCTDAYSGESAVQYKRLVRLGSGTK